MKIIKSTVTEDEVRLECDDGSNQRREIVISLNQDLIAVSADPHYAEEIEVTQSTADWVHIHYRSRKFPGRKGLDG